jgi:hypothetical protein
VSVEDDNGSWFEMFTTPFGLLQSPFSLHNTVGFFRFVYDEFRNGSELSLTRLKGVMLILDLLLTDSENAQRNVYLFKSVP